MTTRQSTAVQHLVKKQPDPGDRARKCHKLSDEFNRLSKLCEGNTVTLLTLLKSIRLRGHALLTLFLAFPFMLPIPVPGLSVLFGLMIMYAGIRIALGQKPWLPRKWLRRKLPASIFAKIFTAGEKVFRRFEWIIKPRGKFLHAPWLQTLNGILICLAGFLLSLPLPPGTNFPPALVIVFLSIGMLEEDGLAIALGYISFVINIAFFAGISFLGIEGVKRLLSISF